MKRVALCAAVLVLATGAAAQAAVFTPGSPGLGDPFFPLAGNGGYDVAHYDLELGYDPASNQLSAHAEITATATQNLSRFDLDLRGFSISRLRVNGDRASFRRAGEQELVITPRDGIRAGRRFTTTIDYAGEPQVVTDPDESIEGWVPTDDGAYVVGEPQGSPGWYPANDNPQDKATFDISVTVPEGITAMSNGVLVDRDTRRHKTTWSWRETDPMAPYLATATLGRFDLDILRIDEIPTYVAVDPVWSKDKLKALEKLPDIVDFLESIYGRYPFNAVGAIVDNAPDVGYSLESQTKPNYDSAPGESLIVHETSHQWFGDSVTLSQWPDIWLHEGFATWTEFYWSEVTGGPTAQEIFDELYAIPADDAEFWTPAPNALGEPAFLFSGVVYDRGAMTLQALREKVGDFAFFRIMRGWATQNRYGNVTTGQFEHFAEQISGKRLNRFFEVWLRRAEKPTSW
jgi:aminopeptidase N